MLDVENQEMQGIDMIISKVMIDAFFQKGRSLSSTNSNVYRYANNESLVICPVSFK